MNGATLAMSPPRIVIAAVLVLCEVSLANAARCADYRTCEQAVAAWCAGRHPRADGDNDGIPCENVCRSKAQVDAIRARIGC